MDRFESVTSELLRALPITDAIGESRKRECWDYGQVFHARGREVEEAGDQVGAAAWQLLAQICQMKLQRSDVAEPFRATYVSSEGRSLLPEDLPEEALLGLGRPSDGLELRRGVLHRTGRSEGPERPAAERAEASARYAGGNFDPHGRAHAHPVSGEPGRAVNLPLIAGVGVTPTLRTRRSGARAAT